MSNSINILPFKFLPFRRFCVDYSLVGRRDGLSMREPDSFLWRKNDYRRGYAEGLIATAKRIAQIHSLSDVRKSLYSEEERT